MKTFIENRNGQKIAVVVDISEDQQGLAFVMHGLGGFKEQPHIQTFADAFRENNFTVILFDTTNTLGESDGKYEDATITNYFEDLEDVIEWSSTQNWYEEPFWLIGHSLGGISTSLFAETYPQKVKGLAPISTVVSGKLSLETGREELKSWRESGWKEQESVSKPGFIKRLPWSHIEDRLKYDLVPQANKLTMPVLLIVGEKDDGTPPEHQRLLFNNLPGKKELHIIKDGPHTFRDAKQLKEIKKIIKEWIKSTDHFP
jgi:pimeloyl-ACP methyl ester carboxylesterase